MSHGRSVYRCTKQVFIYHRQEDENYNFLRSIDLFVVPENTNPWAYYNPAIYSLYFDDNFEEGKSRVLAGTESAVLELSYSPSHRVAPTVLLGYPGDSGMDPVKIDAKIGRVTGIVAAEQGSYLISDATYHFIRHFVESIRSSDVAMGVPGEPGNSSGKIDTPGELIRNSSDTYLILCKQALYVYNRATSEVSLLLRSPSVAGFTDLIVQSGTLLSGNR